MATATLKIIQDNPEKLFDKRVRDWVSVFNMVGFEVESTTTTITTGSGGIIDCGDRMTGNEVLDMGNRV